jgi:uncharacterized protein YbjQ (UPF0145 family)
VGAGRFWSFIATGTAVRALGSGGTGTAGAHRAPDGRAFTSDLPAQDLLRLAAAGAVPVAFVPGVCGCHIAHQPAMASLRQAGRNQQMVVFTQGIYQAREPALARMQAEAAQARSPGIAGVSVEVSNHVGGEHATEFLATATAIGASAMNTGSPRPRRSPPSRWASTAKQRPSRQIGTDSAIDAPASGSRP